ncbi:hypothetical protein NC652_021419 [Populus alba x Populus x berolinensis]|nr:hypothetical protein NC652_021419 [Populus alba x Populus x berolinensis]
MLCVETFNNSVFGISKLCSRSKHTPKERLFEEVDHHDFQRKSAWQFVIKRNRLSWVLMFPQPFPQTYADLQNAHFGIEDGQHLISIGKATPSRQPASYSWAFTEVVLGYEIVNNESKHAVDVINTGGKKTIYSHLKKYFCGTRFTRLPFHRLGDVCVSGKASRFDTIFFFVSVLIKRYQLSSYFFIQ